VADEIAALKSGRNLRQVARYVLGAGLGICVLVLLFGRRGELMSAWIQLGHVAAGWVLAAVASEALSLWAFAYLQHRVLGLAGAAIPMPGLFLLTLANDAIANTVPGEPAVSSAYRYRYYRRRGASGASAGWTIFTILIAQAIGMALLLLLGVLVALGATPGARNTRAAVVGLVIIAAAVAVLLRRDLVLRLAEAMIRAARRMTGHPRGSAGARISAALARMREIPLGVRSTAGVVAIATLVWGCDFGCLLCSFGAVHAGIPWNGVLLAYGVAVVAGTLPFVPGGIGVVEGSLAVVLAAYGASQTQALSAALVFRMVSFWLAVAVGWISVAVIARQARRPGTRVALGLGAGLLALRAPDRGAATDARAAERGPAPRAMWHPLVPDAGQPGRPGRNAASPDAGAKHPAHLGMQRAQLLRGQRPRDAARMYARAPQDFVSQQVPEPGDDLLVDQCGLDGRAAALKQPGELLRPNAQGVRSERAE